jgi:hypothetical protein
MKLKIILFNLSIIIFLICLIYLYIYVNYKYEGFVNSYQAEGDPGEVFRAEGERKTPITEKTTVSNALNESDTIAKINPKMDELEKVGNTEATAIPARIIPYFNVSRAASSKPPVDDGYYWIDFNDTDFLSGLTSYAGATLNPIANSTHRYLLYKSSGILSITDDYLCDILVVGGGGSGGGAAGGGGGAGGLIYLTDQTVKAGTYTIIIGNGGIINGFTANNGEDSRFNNIIAMGGGKGSTMDNAPGDGGSGGGGNRIHAASAPPSVKGQNGGNGKMGQGYKGGDGKNQHGFDAGGGGGGGAGGEGESAFIKGRGANGGIGLQVAITGVPTYYAGGGGGGSASNYNTAGLGGNGGGGDGAIWANQGSSGMPNTGGGGGGGSAAHGTGRYGGNGGSGVVIIRLKEKASMGKKYTYCIMDRNYFGGGWMLAMRAVRGSRTFGYNSDHWTNATTLNDTIEKIRDASVNADLKISSIGNIIYNHYDGNDYAINRYDAKYDIFNKYKAKEWMAIFYFKYEGGVAYKGGDIITGGNENAKGWIWRETNLIEPDNIERTPLQLFQKRSNTSLFNRYTSLIDLRGNYGVRNVKELDKFKPSANMPRLWSSQHGYSFYGINYDVPELFEGYLRRGASTRWGFAWNENWDYANNNGTNDVYGGIGLRYPGSGRPGYSAGDFIYCCEDGQGVKSSIAFEWYVR